MAETPTAKGPQIAVPIREAPRYDWRQFKGDAKSIVEEVGRDIRIISTRGERWRKGETLATDEADLKKIIDDLARLLAHAAEDYDDAKAYCDAMDMPTKRERPSQAKKPAKAPKKHDYTAEQSIEETWRQYTDMLALFPKRKRGNPTKTRKGEALELGPLVPVYRLARRWWMKTTNGKFTPSFAGGDDVISVSSTYGDADDTDEIDKGSDYNNSDSRFLLMVLQFVEPRCKASHAIQLHDRCG